MLDHTPVARQKTTMLIYKIFRADEWAQLVKDGQTKGAPIDLADGYIHFSSADTVARTAELYFADMHDLMLIAVEADGLDGLVWETSRGGAQFPHLYREMMIADVAWSRPLPIVDGAHQFGDLSCG